MSNNEVKFYFDTELARVPEKEALPFLKEYEQFTVFVGFVNPASGLFTEGTVVCYPNPQKSYGTGGLSGWCFITEHEGILFRLPADMGWWSRRGNGGESGKITQQVTYLHRGEIKTANIDVDVVGGIRIPNIK